MLLPIWAKPAIAAVALVAAFSAGWTVNGWRHEAKQADALREQQAAFQRQLAKQNKEAESYEQVREQTRVDSRTREAEIREVFRDVEVPTNCAVPDDVRSVLQRAVDSANLAGQPGAAVPDTAEPASGSR